MQPPHDRPLWQQRGAVVLLLNTLLMYGGFYMLVPFIAVHGTRDLGLNGAAVGLVLSLRVFSQQGLMVFGGALGDRIGHKPVLAAGMLIRAFGFVAFALATNLSGLLGAALLSALGGMFFESTGKAALAGVVTVEQRLQAFSLYSVAGQVGSALGPLVGAALLPASFVAVGFSAAACFATAFVMILALLPGTPSAQPSTRMRSLSTLAGITQMLIAVTNNRRFVHLTLLTLGYWFVFVQFTLSLPLYLVRQHDSAEELGLLYAFYSGLAILLQVPLISWISRRLSPGRIMAFGTALIALGWGFLPVGGSLVALLASVACLALGDMLVQPTSNNVASNLAKPGAMASYFGFAALGLAFGGGLGNALGGALFDWASALGSPLLPWLIYAGIAGVTTAGLLRYAQGESVKRET